MDHYSHNCSDDLDTFWDESSNTCVPCHQHNPIRPGYEFSPNCGRHDDGGRSEIPYRPCVAAQSFNNGSFVKCQPCSRCAPNHQKLSECNATTDTQCCVARDQTRCWKGALSTTTRQVQRSTTLRFQVSTSNPTTAKHIDQRLLSDSATSHVNHQTAWIVLTVVLVFSVLAFLLFNYIKTRRRRSRPFCFRDMENTHQRSRSNKTTAAVNEEVALLQSETRSLEDILSELSSAITNRATTSLLFIGITSTSTSLLFHKLQKGWRFQFATRISAQISHDMWVVPQNGSPLCLFYILSRNCAPYFILNVCYIK
uniref:TNFR-Cys domain-containing protein n=1 Tax=Oncorhynchus kisutch TaxID=8019 RepID=A0A8C7CE54_ONCKI